MLAGSADPCHRNTLLVIRCLLHLWSRCLLAHLKLIIDIQMTAALLDCHLHRPGEYCRCCWQSSHRDGGWSTEAAPFLPLGTAWGNPALRGAGSCLACRQKHQRSLVSNARRDQEHLTHTQAASPRHAALFHAADASRSIYMCKVLLSAQQTRCTSASALCVPVRSCTLCGIFIPK